MGRVGARAGAVTLAGLGGLHLAWGQGSSWPLADRATLATTVTGQDEFPTPAACFAVASALGVAAALVAGGGGDRPVARLGRLGVAAVLGLRGVAGVTGQTHRLVGWETDDAFKARDRRYFGPLCLTLASAAASSSLRRVRSVGV